MAKPDKWRKLKSPLKLSMLVIRPSRGQKQRIGNILHWGTQRDTAQQTPIQMYQAGLGISPRLESDQNVLKANACIAKPINLRSSKFQEIISGGSPGFLSSP